MKDPTRDDLEEALDAYPFASECDTFDREEAIYAFASDWHSGQGSSLYSVLSTSRFHPGPLWHEPGECGLLLYDWLQGYFA
jgi:hypothetical protein